MKKKKREEDYQLEMLEGAKLIGAGAATIASAGAAIGIGNVLSSSIHSVARNPSLAKQLFGYAILGFALAEAIASFTPMVAFLISSVFRSKNQRKKSPPRIQKEGMEMVLLEPREHKVALVRSAIKHVVKRSAIWEVLLVGLVLP
nr:ATPase subunit 9, mitochondrial [Tanacetum cinerariifolium]